MSNKDYSKVSSFYDEVYHKESTAPTKQNRFFDKLSKRIEVKKGQSVLDVACGQGEWLSELYRKGLKVSGIDISKNAINACERNIPEGEFSVGVAEELPFPDEHFHIVTCLGSLEHFLDQPKALREMLRVAKPDAKILILVPNSGFLTYRLGLYKGTQQQQIKETIRSLEEWQSLFEQAGLKVNSKWRDLHMVQKSWVVRKPFVMIPLRIIQLLALSVWPLSWQYQVYHLCQKNS